RRLPQGAAHEGVVRDPVGRARGLAGADVPVSHGSLAESATNPAGQDDPVHGPGELERCGDRAGLPGPAPSGIGVSLSEESAPRESPPPAPLDRQKEPSPLLLLCVGLAAVQPAAPAASPPRDRPLDSGAAGGSGPDPRGGDPDPGSERRRAASVRDDPLS